MFRNPVEPKLGMEGAAEFYLKGLPIIDADTETDIILVQMAVDIYGGHTPDLAETVTESGYALCAAADSIKKPMVVALFSAVIRIQYMQWLPPEIFSRKPELRCFRE